MMNKKGQVLVVFVLILPILIIFLGLVVDIGNSLVKRKKYENVITDIILYNYKEDSEEITDDDLEHSEESEEIENPSETEEEPSEPINEKEVDLSLIEKNIKDSIEDFEEINIEVEEEILKVNVKAQYKSVFSKIFNIGLNTIKIEVKYDIKNKKIVRE